MYKVVSTKQEPKVDQAFRADFQFTATQDRKKKKLNNTTTRGRSEIKTKIGTFHRTTDPVFSTCHCHEKSKQQRKKGEMALD